MQPHHWKPTDAIVLQLPPNCSATTLLDKVTDTHVSNQCTTCITYDYKP